MHFAGLEKTPDSEKICDWETEGSKGLRIKNMWISCAERTGKCGNSKGEKRKQRQLDVRTQKKKKKQHKKPTYQPKNKTNKHRESQKNKTTTSKQKTEKKTNKHTESQNRGTTAGGKTETGKMMTKVSNKIHKEGSPLVKCFLMRKIQRVCVCLK